LDTHEHYEELCALVASGQASQAELTDLKVHLESCLSCRGLVDDFTQISAHGLSVLATKRLQCQTPSGMTPRFIARARSEGIEINRAAVAAKMSTNQRTLVRALGAAAAVVLIASTLTILRTRLSPAGSQASGPTQQASVVQSAVPSPPVPGDKKLEEQLAEEREELGALAAKIRAQRDELDDLNKINSSLNSRLTEAQQQNAGFQSAKSELEARVTQLQAELEKSKSDKGATDVAFTLQETELRELQRKIDDQSSLLRQQEDLTVKGSDVRDLIVARNLHIIDVHDRDGDGKSQRAFGRIFYTEGKSLIFYAYDLTDPRKVDARVSFYVWGGRLGSEKPIQSLGVLRNDDASDRRWMLTFDDPHVLAQIDSVFVTVESSRKPVREPGSPRRLVAFLGEPNHP
jgi:hypothetical protein